MPAVALVIRVGADYALLQLGLLLGAAIVGVQVHGEVIGGQPAQLPDGGQAVLVVVVLVVHHVLDVAVPVLGDHGQPGEIGSAYVWTQVQGGERSACS